MDRDQFIQTLARVSAVDVIKAYETHSPTEYAFEAYIDMDKKTRTQVVRVSLSDDVKYVIAYSVIGDCPNDPDALIALLKENVDGCYSRLGIIDDQLVQLYKYPLEEVEEKEMLKAFEEVSMFADYYENKYFGGVDNR